MYETNLQFSIGFVAALLMAAFVLPAVTDFHNLAQTAAGAQIALMLLVIWITRLLLVPDQSSWLNAARFPLALLAAFAALNFSPQGAAVVADLVTLAGLANWAVFGQAPSDGNLGQRALNVLSLTLCLGTVSWITRPLADESFDAVTSEVILAVQFPIFWLFYPYMERRLLPK
jgi:hypothetical protein